MKGQPPQQSGNYRYNEVVERIKEKIRRGEVKVGERIPAERILAQQFGVSRNCVRQAIQALTEKRILESRRGDGTYVRAVDETELIDAFLLPLRKQQDLLREILEFRLLMEPQIAALAAGNITHEEIDRLKIIVCDQQRRIMSGRQDGELDSTFHLKLAAATKNRLIVQMMDTVNEILNESRVEELWSQQRRKTSVVGHLKIVDALENRDPGMAFEAMKEHLSAIEQIILTFAENSKRTMEKPTP